jgi:two-component system, sensor histidine kinase and response regulator
MAQEKKVRKILLVDDEAGFAELLRDLLEMDGYEVTVAGDGVEAIEKLESLTPDVIISDVVMPRMNGFEMFRQIKNSPKTSSIPFLFISGFQDQRVLDEARKIGVFGILQKPIDVEQVEYRLKELMRQKN